MIYVFDSSSLSQLKHFDPGIFKSIWEGLDALVSEGNLLSNREVRKELQAGMPNPHVDAWIKANKAVFTTPTNDELEFVAEIFRVKHFQSLIGAQQRLKGKPVADPFVIACARYHEGTVVTEEKKKPNAAKIPNVCAHFGIKCTDLTGFMREQNWSF